MKRLQNNFTTVVTLSLNCNHAVAWEPRTVTLADTAVMGIRQQLPSHDKKGGGAPDLHTPVRSVAKYITEKTRINHCQCKPHRSF